MTGLAVVLEQRKDILIEGGCCRGLGWGFRSEPAGGEDYGRDEQQNDLYGEVPSHLFIVHGNAFSAIEWTMKLSGLWVRTLAKYTVAHALCLISST
jgi:hypothetical protein